MSAQPHIRCLVCNTPRPPRCFGMSLDGEALDDAASLPEPEVLTRHIAGPRQITWERSPLPLLAARALRRRLRAALKYLDSLLAEVDEDERDAA